MNRLFGTLCVLWMLFPKTISAAEFRSLWVDAFGPGFFNAQEVSNLVSDCRKYNFNAVFVEMRARGNAFYMPHSGNGDIRRSVLATNYDALPEIIRQCHEGTPRIEVHCWASAQYVWASPNPPLTANHVFNLHPEYLTKDSVGQTFIEKGYFLDPGHPDACQWNHVWRWTL